MSQSVIEPRTSPMSMDEPIHYPPPPPNLVQMPISHAPMIHAPVSQRLSAHNQDEATECESDHEPYRAVCPVAIAAILFGLLSPFIWFDPILAMVPLCGIYLAFRAVGRINADSTHLTGLGLARIGLALSVICLFGGLGTHAYIFATEVPPGFERITFETLSPDPNVVGQPFPPKIGDLDGKKVFIKGYMKPGPTNNGITDFLLVRDRGECCFGTTKPIITDRIHVRLNDTKGLDYNLDVKAWGTFRFDPTRVPGVYYYLDFAEAR